MLVIQLFVLLCFLRLEVCKFLREGVIFLLFACREGSVVGRQKSLHLGVIRAVLIERLQEGLQWGIRLRFVMNGRWDVLVVCLHETIHRIPLGKTDAGGSERILMLCGDGATRRRKAREGPEPCMQDLSGSNLHASLLVGLQVCHAQ